MKKLLLLAALSAFLLAPAHAIQIASLTATGRIDADNDPDGLVEIRFRDAFTPGEFRTWIPNDEPDPENHAYGFSTGSYLEINVNFHSDHHFGYIGINLLNGAYYASYDPREITLPYSRLSYDAQNGRGVFQWSALPFQASAPPPPSVPESGGTLPLCILGLTALFCANSVSSARREAATVSGEA